jgi:hypothetical protein
LRRFIRSNVLQLNYARIAFWLDAFRGYEAASGSGSSHVHSTPAHNHKMFGNAGVALGATPTRYNCQDSTGATIQIDLSTTFNVDLWSFGPTAAGTSGPEGTHTHPMVPGIYESTVATNVKVIINGVDRTVALGGPGGGFTTNQQELEVSQWLTIGQWNTIELTPSGLGRIYLDYAATGWVQAV